MLLGKNCRCVSVWGLVPKPHPQTPPTRLSHMLRFVRFDAIVGRTVSRVNMVEHGVEISDGTKARQYTLKTKTVTLLT